MECCSSCHLPLKEPYVVCCDCPPQQPHICLSCFSRGSQFGSHLNTHRYRVKNDSFTVLDPEWTAEEESQLLNLLLQRGQGNWDDVAKAMPSHGSKTPAQCAEHFQRYYMDNSSGLMLDTWKSTPAPSRRDRPVPLVAPLDFPPRPAPGTAGHKDLGGYSAARGDFDFELDNAAEVDVANVDFDTAKTGYDLRETSFGATGEFTGDDSGDKSLDALLQMTSVEVYNNRLRERRRIKAIVRELGLLNKTRVLSSASRHEQLAQMGGPHYTKLRRFARLMCGVDYDFVLEGLGSELSLRQEILHLQEYRRNGITRTDSTAFFAKLKRQREKDAKEIPADTVLDWIRSGCFPGIYKKTGVAAPLAAVSSRRSAAPLDLVGLPGAGRLTEEERELCSKSRVVPETYFEVRDAMVTECKENGGLRLADARPLAKMDVNKTRKIYDFLMARGDIHKPK